MKRLLFVLSVVAALALMSTSAFAVTAADDFESAVIGPINGQDTGSGWAAPWVQSGIIDANRKAEAYQVGEGENKLLAMMGTGSPEVYRNFDQSLVAAEKLWLSFEVEMLGNLVAGYNIDLLLRNGTTECVQLKFQWDAQILWRSGTNVTLGYWDGREADQTPNSILDFRASVGDDGWRQFIWGVDLVTDTTDIYVRDPATGAYLQIGANLPIKTPTDQLTNFRVSNTRTGTNDYTEWFGVDNIQISTSNPLPEPGSLLALASGLVGLSGVVIRRRR